MKRLLFGLSALAICNCGEVIRDPIPSDTSTTKGGHSSNGGTTSTEDNPPDGYSGYPAYPKGGVSSAGDTVSGGNDSSGGDSFSAGAPSTNMGGTSAEEGGAGGTAGSPTQEGGAGGEGGTVDYPYPYCTDCLITDSAIMHFCGPVSLASEGFSCTLVYDNTGMAVPNCTISCSAQVEYGDLIQGLGIHHFAACIPADLPAECTLVSHQ